MQVTATAYPVDDLSGSGTPLQISDNSAKWDEAISEPGSGSVVIQNDITRPRLVAFDIGGNRVWTMLVRDYERIRVVRRGKGKRQTTLSGPGHLAVMQDALVYPTFGLTAYPKQSDMHYDYRHPGFSDPLGLFVAATNIVSVDDAKSGGGSPWPIPWTDNMPGGFGSTTQIVWASSGDEASAPVGRVPFRHEFDTVWDGVYDLFFTADNSGEIYIDGCFIGSAGGPGSIAEAGFATTGDLAMSVHITPGHHVLSGFAVNWPPYGGATSPGGIAYALYIPGGPPSSTPQLIIESSAVGTTLVEYIDDGPGMTVGNAMRLAVEPAQSYGEIPFVDISSFSDTQDSAGEDWAVDGDTGVMPCISTKVLNDIGLLLNEVSVSYADVWMDPSSFKLKLYNHGARNNVSSGLTFFPADPDAPDPDAPQVEGLIQRGTYKLFNAGIFEYQGGFLEVTDDVSIAAHGRHAAMLQIGAVDDVNEAYRVATKALAAFANPREEIGVQVEGPVGGVDYELGNTVTTLDSDDNEIEERITAIGVSMTSTGRAKTTPTIKDLFT